jgi:Domain of unknown function (DUF4166)/Saccharopine dehydrogenase NADP binding domain
MTGRLKVLILGGYGAFGGRLAQLLADEPKLTLIVAGRSRSKAETFCAGLAAQAELVPLTFDRDADAEAQLRAIAPSIVVDATGPFQTYGDPYRVVRAALALGIAYLDLADSSDFVTGIEQFDAAAKARGTFILSGASSFPVLTAAVVRCLSLDMTRVEAVSGGIAPSPYAGVGLNVIRAIASYAGRPVATGRGSTGTALVDARRYTISPPGHPPLHPTRFSLVDVPDMKVLPALWPGLKSVWMGAGPVPEILHRVLNAFAWTVRAGLLPSLSPLAPLMHRAVKVLRWGEHRGGMFVTVTGVGAGGTTVERSWHLTAEGDDGPFIPSMTAEAIIRNCLADRVPAAGARSAATELELADYQVRFARWRIRCGIREPLPATAPLYRRVLNEAWGTLPEPLRVMHDLKSTLTAEGVATVTRGSGLLARCIAALIDFPPAGAGVPVKVTFETQGGGELWRREFAAHAFASTQEEGRGRFAGLLCESFGPLTFGLALVVEDGRMKLVVRRWSFLGLPLPRALAPCGDAYESAEDGRFNFHVEIGHRLTGLIVRYEGWLVPRA